MEKDQPCHEASRSSEESCVSPTHKPLEPAHSSAYIKALTSAKAACDDSFLRQAKPIIHETLPCNTPQGVEPIAVHVKEALHPCYALIFEISRKLRLKRAMHNGTKRPMKCTRVVTEYEFDHLLPWFKREQGYCFHAQAVKRIDVIRFLLKSCSLVEEDGALHLRFAEDSARTRVTSVPYCGG